MTGAPKNLVRRLLNTREEASSNIKAGVVDHYARNSGYDINQTRRIILEGVKGYFSKLRRRKLSGRRIHYISEESRETRMRKKLLGKTSWYRGKKMTRRINRINQREEQEDQRKQEPRT